MVYCGKPSTSCEACRERKSRCDKLPDGCTQCAKAKRVCPGYRQLGDVIFHNESENVVRKIKAKEARLKAKKDAIASSSKTVTPEASTPSISPREHVIVTIGGGMEGDEDPVDDFCGVKDPFDQSLVPLTLLPSPEDQATGFFVTNFVIPTKGSKYSRLDYLDAIYKSEAIDEGLISSMRAVGFAGYAHSTQNPRLLRNARDHYTQALKYTNKALTCPQAAKKDTVLLSIIVLGLFEAITGTQQSSLRDWSKHINGAAAVIKLRGDDQIKTPSGRRMLIQVTMNLLITCLSQSKPLPQYLTDLTFEAMTMAPNPEPGFKIQAAMIQGAKLRSEITHEIITDPEIILQQAIEYDSPLLELCENPPDGWEYETIYTDIDSPYIFNGCYHMYLDCFMAQLWNALRVVRIMFNEIIRNVLLKGFSSSPPTFTLPIHTAQFQLSTDTLYTMQRDILSSVPQHILQQRRSPSARPSLAFEGAPFLVPDSNTMQGEEDIPFVSMYGGSFLLWPLWYAGVIDAATEEVRKWVSRNLREISRAMGIKQGDVLAEILDMRSAVEKNFT